VQISNAGASATGNRFAGLDHLRALAIIIVFVFHYNMFGHPPGLYKHLGSWGWTGVDLFFVLSGYLIGGQLFAKLSRDQPIHYGEFYFKRTLRILPAYFAVLILYLAIPAFAERSTLPPLWRFLTFTQNFGLDLSQHGAFSHAWSLCIEEQFYLILPLLLILFSRRTKQAVWTLAVLFLFGFVIRSFIWFDILPYEASFGKSYYRLIYYPTWSRLDGLLAGVALSALYYFRPAAWQRLTHRGNLLLIIAIAMIAGAWLLAHDEHQYEMRGAIFGYPAISIAYGALVLAALSPTCVLYRYSSSLTRWIANLSYAVYLTHKQLIHLTHQALKGWNISVDSYAAFWICVAVALLGGWLLHITVERPFLRLRDRILARRKAARNTSPETSSPTSPPAHSF
jgi:peptidoglycan/LPS O-acetylase OafA/YrhL